MMHEVDPAAARAALDQPLWTSQSRVLAELVRGTCPRAESVTYTSGHASHISCHHPGGTTYVLSSLRQVAEYLKAWAWMDRRKAEG